MPKMGQVRQMKLRDKFSTSTLVKLTRLPGTLEIFQQTAKSGYL